MVPSLVLASVLSSASVQLSFQAGTGLGIRVVPPLPSSPGPRPISSPPQLELVLLPSPSRYLIAEEPELAPPWVWLLYRQDQCCFLGSAAQLVSTLLAGGKSVGRSGGLSAQGVGYKLFSLRGWESLATSTLGTGLKE